MTFEEKLKRIDEICCSLESGKLSLDDSIKIYEEGMKLTKECLDTIDNAKGKIVEIKKKLDNTVVEEEFSDGE